MAKAESTACTTADPEQELGRDVHPGADASAGDRAGAQGDGHHRALALHGQPLPIHVFKMAGDNIGRVLAGERVGTIVTTPAAG